MFWADELIKERQGKELINDSWTPSGIVHMGSLKGPVIHDTLYKILQKAGKDVTFTYGFDDADPIDGLPPELHESHSKYLGVPIYLAPSPDGNGSFGDYYGNKMRKLLDTLEIFPKLYKTSELYTKGTFNPAIKHILDHADKVRAVYAEINKKVIAPTWFPLQVVCPSCGKLGTTKVTGWNGIKVTFTCERNLVTWAQGCGATGEISPFNGKAKMPWKVEWAAKWWAWDVTIEGAGKDHGSAGGSYDVARKICSDVFGKEPPIKLVYEFFLAGGKKMSSSKGIGLNGEELLEVLPSDVARYLMIYKQPNQAVEFAPYGTHVIPQLFDDYQKAFTIEESAEKSEDKKRAYTLSQTTKSVTPPTLSFSKIVSLIQMPNMKHHLVEARAESWTEYAKTWIEKYAPDSEKFLVQEEVPSTAASLSQVQKQYLRKIATVIERKHTPEDLQAVKYEAAKELSLPSKDAFSTIYTALIGKPHGPKAAWLLESLDPTFVKQRFLAVADTAHVQHNEPPLQPLDNPAIFSIDTEVTRRYPSVSVGVAIIKNVSIEKTDLSLQAETQKVLESLRGLTTETLGNYPEITAYRKLYKAMGVDWHSRRPSPEALLRRVALKKELYSINTRVDAYNLLVMKHRISIGAFDLDKLTLPTVLRHAKPTESILLLGDTEHTLYKASELAYFDEEGGFNLDFNYRDAQRTAVTLHTKNIYINVDGIFDISPREVQKVLEETCDTIRSYCGGTVEVIGVETAE